MPGSLKDRSLRGIYLLEFSLVTIGLVLFVIGILDVASILRARSALRAGVSSGLRCLYPTDTDCAGAGREAISGNGPFFDVFGPRDVNRVFYEIPLFRVEAGSEWYEVPAQSYRIDASAAFPRKRFSIVRDTNVYSAAELYLQQVTSLPAVSGARTTDPRFVFPEGSSSSGLITSALPVRLLSGIDCSSDGRPCATGTFSMQVDPIIGEGIDLLRQSSNSECMSADGSGCILWDPRGATSARRPAAYDDNRPGFDVTQALVHVSGRVVDAEPGAAGSIELSIEYPSAPGPEGKMVTRALGGRIVSAGSNGSFLMRGLGGFGDSDKQKDEGGDVPPYESEIHDHAYLAIPSGRPFSLKFRIASSNGKRIGWVGESVRVVTPTYEVKTRPFVCGPVPEGVDALTVCSTAAKGPLAPGSIVQTETQTSLVRAFDCSSEPPSLADAATIDTSNLRVVEVGDGSACSPVRETIDCGETAIVTEAVCSSSKIDDSAYRNVCALPADAMDIMWIKTPIGQAVTAQTCTFDSEAGQLACETATYTSSDGGAPKSGVDICNLAVYHHPTLSTDVMPYGTCPSNSPITIQGELVAKVRESSPPSIGVRSAVSSAGKRYVQERPTDPCIQAQEQPADSAQTEVLIATNVTREEARRACGDSVQCRLVEVAPSRETKEASIDGALVERASVRAREAVAAVWPGAATVCEAGRDCAQFSFHIDAATSQAVGSATATVPLKLLSLVPGRSDVTLTFADARTLEEEIGRQSFRTE